MQNEKIKDEKVFETAAGGRLKINNSTEFLKMLSGIDPEAHEKLSTYGMKVITRFASDIPWGDRESLLNMSITKAMNSFDSGAGANILTYFTMKVRAEIKDYKDKRESMHKKIMNTIDNRDENTEFCIQGKEGESYLEPVDMRSEEDKLLGDDFYKRQITAFKMAFSGIPLLSQNILTRSSSTRESMDQIAYELYSHHINNVSEEYRAEVQAKWKKEVVRLRNQALALVFERVLRSNHLTNDEKEGILAEHNLDKKDIGLYKKTTEVHDNF